MALVAGSMANSVFFYLYTDGKNRYGYDQNNPYQLKNLLVSYRAGIASMFICAPLWTLKTRMVLFQEYKHLNDTTKVGKGELPMAQSRHIFKKIVTELYKEEGVKGFYRGFVPSLFMCNYGVI